MNQNFKEKQRQNILIKVVKKYEEKINEKDNHIKELNKKKSNSQDFIRGANITIKYWSVVVLINLVLFPIIGHLTSTIIHGITMWILTSLAVGVSMLLCKPLKNKATKVSNEISEKINIEEKDKSEYQKDLDALKKKITPVHVEYDIKPNYNNEQEENIDTFNENISNSTESTIEGPTLVKRNRSKRIFRRNG